MIKFFVFLFLSLHYVAEAQRNRSTVWFLSNNQIYSTSAGYTACTSSVTAATATTFLTTSNLKIAGDLYPVVRSRVAGSAGPPVVPSADTFVTSTAILESLTITFYYNSTYFLTLSLPSARTTTVVLNTAPTVSATAASILTPLRTSYTLSSSLSTLPVVADSTNVYQPNGKVWLTFTSIPGVFTAATTTPLTAGNDVYSFGFVVQDYISSSTISVVQWVDSLNSIYQFGANVLTSSITGSSVLNSGCTSVTGKRSVDHFRFKRAAPTGTCPSSSNDATTLPSSTLTSLCTRTNAVVSTTGTATTCAGTLATDGTTSCLADAFRKGVIAIDALSTQSVLFSTSGPRLISGGAHFLLLIGSMLFFLF